MSNNEAPKTETNYGSYTEGHIFGADNTTLLVTILKNQTEMGALLQTMSFMLTDLYAKVHDIEIEEAADTFQESLNTNIDTFWGEMNRSLMNFGVQEWAKKYHREHPTTADQDNG